jgi:hypothetical protein
MQLLRTILIILIVYYLIRLFVRYVLPFAARYFIRKSMNSTTREPRRKKEGEMHIQHSPEQKKNLDNLGEYVDYEEIKEEDKTSAK